MQLFSEKKLPILVVFQLRRSLLSVFLILIFVFLELFFYLAPHKTVDPDEEREVSY